MTDVLRFGIIGTGSIATSAHGPALQRLEGISFWSVLSRDMARATDFAQRFGAVAPRAAHASLSEFLSDPQLQAVIVTSPDGLHSAHIVECARAGKHVLVEKPMVISHQEGLKAIEACRQHGVKLGVACRLRWHRGHRKLHQLVTRDQALGPLRHLRLQWTRHAENVSDSRAHTELGRWWSLAATGTHCLDLVHWFADSSDRSIADSRSLISKEVWKQPYDETAIVLFRYSDGLTAESTTSVLFNSPSRLEIYGANGFAICEETFGREEKGKISINGHPLEFDFLNPFAGQIQDFASAIRENREPEVSGLSGLRVVDDMLRATETA